MNGAEDGAEDAIAMLLSLGWVRAGSTPAETVRVPTAASPVYGRSGGELRTFGGRARLVLPGTDRRVTVGARTTCFYRMGDKGPTGYENLPTRELHKIRERATPAAPGR